MSAVVHFLVGSVPFPALFAACLLAALSHSLLDALTNSNGVQLLFPFTTERYSLPIVMGLNPMTSSARCDQKGALVCSQCHLHSLLLSPIFFLVTIGAVLSIVFTEHARHISGLALVLFAVYLLLCFFQRSRAALHLPGLAPNEEAAKSGTFAANFHPFRWLCAVELADRYLIGLVDTWADRVVTVTTYVKHGEDDAIRASRRARTVQQMLQHVTFPYASSEDGDEGAIVRWRDLRYAFLPHEDIFTTRVCVSAEQEIVSEEFRARWGAG